MPADAAGDEGAGWVQVRGLLEEILEGDLLLPDPSELLNRVAGKPSDDLVELAESPAFALYLINVVRIDVGEGHGKDAVGHVAQYIHCRWFSRATAWKWALPIGSRPLVGRLCLYTGRFLRGTKHPQPAEGSADQRSLSVESTLRL